MRAVATKAAVNQPLSKTTWRLGTYEVMRRTSRLLSSAEASSSSALTSGGAGPTSRSSPSSSAICTVLQVNHEHVGLRGSSSPQCGALPHKRVTSSSSAICTAFHILSQPLCPAAPVPEPGWSAGVTISSPVCLLDHKCRGLEYKPEQFVGLPIKQNVPVREAPCTCLRGIAFASAFAFAFADTPATDA